MFYKEDEISNKFVCQICKEQYKDPRFLPCGDSFCHECILHEIKMNSNQITCFVCKLNYQFPADKQFPKNKFITGLMQIKPLEIKRGSASEKLKQTLQEMTKKSEELRDTCSGSDVRIADYYSGIRAQIDVMVETQIQKIQNYRQSLLNQLKQHETSCLKNLGNNHMGNNIELFLKSIEAFHLQMANYLKVYKTYFDCSYLKAHSKKIAD
jgi:hypothetical protein